jgi:hypothetical protein
MPYFKNEQARSGGANYGHEEAVSERIKEAGFNRIDRSHYPKLSKKILKKWAVTRDDTELRRVTEGLPEGSYILQPAGTQGFPDVLIKDFNDRFVAIECKSGQNGLCPMWNDNLPKMDSIYVLSSGITNRTTVFLGKDVITEEILTNQVEMVKELNVTVNKYKELNQSLDRFGRGWDIKFRPQNFQSGGEKKTNYFTHANRQICEINALEYAKA